MTVGAGRGGEATVALRTFGRLAGEGPGGELTTILRQPKCFGLLVYLALSTREGFCRRDMVVGVFWPDADQDRARAALRNTLYVLRKELPTGAIISEGDEILRVDPKVVWTDAAAFEAAVSSEAPRAALELYRGDFMPGFHLNGGTQFDPWRDGLERTYRRSALAAALGLSESADRDLKKSEAERWLHRAIELAPLDEEPVQRLIRLQRSRGQPGAARSSYDDLVSRLAAIDVGPSVKTNEALEASFDDPIEDAHGWSPSTLATESGEPMPASDPSSRRRAATVSHPEPMAPAPSSPPRRRSRAAVVAAGVCVLVGWHGVGAYIERQWVRTDGFGEFRALIETQDFFGAFALAPRLRPVLAGDAEFEALWAQATFPISVSTSPTPATVFVKDYSRPDDPWVHLGTTPLNGVRIPATYLRWRLERPGEQVVERAALDSYFRESIHFDLPAQSPPSGMSLVSGDALNVAAPFTMELDAFWLDNTEVTNEAFAAFVRSGAYAGLSVPPEGGTHDPPESTRGDRTLVDRSGQPGPSTWASGSHPPGEGGFPVRGVSWYEAQAFCRWAGKELPTVYHWYEAGGFHGYSDILKLSNFSGHGSIPAGESRGIGPYGHADLAGNVREWVANDIDGKRYVLGGAWDSPPYLFFVPEAASPLDRSDQNGFRCAKMREPADHPSRLPLRTAQQASAWDAVDEATFEQYIAHYDYDRSDLEVEIQSLPDITPLWRRELISFDAGYDGERIEALLYLPAQGVPPFSAVIFHPGADANHMTEAELAHTWWFDFLAGGNHAVLYPVYKGTYERRVPVSGPIDYRNQLVQRVKEVRRSFDYLATRRDIDVNRVAYYGFSQGGALAPVVIAVEDRLAAGVVLSAGLFRRAIDPIVEPRNFLGRARSPLLMLGGELDFIFPPDRSQKPFFDAWGAPDHHKRFVSLPFGHAPREMGSIAHEVLNWLDRYLGGAGTDLRGDSRGQKAR